MPRPERDAPLAWLFALQRFGVHPGLERTEALLASAGRPDRALRCVLVGGTNGKGSTARALASCLVADGEPTGLYTSPHLIDATERVVVNDAPVPRDALERAVGDLRPAAEGLAATFFEVLTVAALRCFADAGVRTAVLEVGLGGRLDATNAVTPGLSLLTTVALDHTAVLGGTLEAIAGEKAGITRPGVPALSAADGRAWQVLERAVAERGVRLERVRAEGASSLGWGGSRFVLPTDDGPLTLRTPLVGAHQVANAALAAAAALRLGVRRSAVRRGVGAARWPGRLERLRWRGRWWVLDGAHNPAAAAALAAALAALPGRPDLVVLGTSADKDVEGLAEALAPLSAPRLATRAALSPRALPPEALAPRIGADAAAPDPESALAWALEHVPEGGTVVVAGSLFLVGEVRARLLGRTLPATERWQ